MKKLLIALSLCGIGTSVAAEEREFLFDMSKLHPKAYALWQEVVPTDAPAWLRTLQGTASPIRDVTVDGAAMKFGTVCMPHFCGDNVAGVLFTLNEDRIGALVNMEGYPTRAIGNVTELTCIALFAGDSRITKC
jgi:hypothetical protein